MFALVNSETNVNAYTLHMVEDDGEVDSDFPPLEGREPFSKFGFNKLALVVKSVVLRSAVKQSTDVTVLVLLFDIVCGDLLINDNFLRKSPHVQ